jgi:purine-nucleoside phosphorylase
MKKPPGYPEALKAAKYLNSRWRQRPRVGIILGSGLGDVVDQVQSVAKIPYRSIPYFPRPSVKGHSGTLHLGTWGQTPVALLEGRMHLYEGYAPAEVVFAARVLILAGVEILIVTCAAGGIAPKATPASFMFFSDHLNFQGANPLAGAHDERWGQRFVDLSKTYDPELRAKAGKAARAKHLKFSEGVYVALLGPSYETPAEIRALKQLGAGAVGMSTVPEVIAARQMGARVLAVATISNRACGLSDRPLSHEEVLEVGKKSAKNLIKLFDTLLVEI